MLVNLLIAPVMSLLWLVGLLVFVLGFYVSLKNSPTDPKIYQSLVNIPKFMFYQLTALVNARRANKISVATRQENKTQG
ncbi:hypothetical protein D3C87_2067770 [compost metagenome]